MNRDYEAVVIGVSAGGMSALRAIVPGLPAGFDMAIIIVQHLHHDSGDYLPVTLNRESSITVKEADEKEMIKNGTVYIAPTGYHLLIEEDRTFSLSCDPPVNYSIPSIDLLFESAADVYGDTLIGVVLTGANSDGSLGLKKISEAGGLTIVQDPLTAEAQIMPRKAIKTVHPDHIVALSDITSLLISISKRQLRRPI